MLARVKEFDWDSDIGVESNLPKQEFDQEFDQKLKDCAAESRRALATRIATSIASSVVSEFKCVFESRFRGRFDCGVKRVFRCVYTQSENVVSELW